MCILLLENDEDPVTRLSEGCMPVCGHKSFMGCSFLEVVAINQSEYCGGVTLSLCLNDVDIEGRRRRLSLKLGYILDHFANVFLLLRPLSFTIQTKLAIQKFY